MNEILLGVVILGVTGGAAVAYDPRLAKWVASVLFARALAVEAGREMYAVARHSGLELGRIVVLEAPKSLVLPPRSRA